MYVTGLPVARLALAVCVFVFLGIFQFVLQNSFFSRLLVLYLLERTCFIVKQASAYIVLRNWATSPFFVTISVGWPKYSPELTGKIRSPG
jgi:hypothetical protein